MVILGINAYHGDVGVALLIDGQLVAAAEEERFNGFKHAAGLRVQAMGYSSAMPGLNGPNSEYFC